MARGKKKQEQADNETPPAENKAPNVTDETIAHHAKLILEQEAVWDAAKKTAKSEGGRYRALYKDAKKDGIDPDHLAQAVAERKLEALSVAQRNEGVHRILRVMRSPVARAYHFGTDGQGFMFELSADEAGYEAGKAARPASDNPHQPGTEEHQDWRSGWERYATEMFTAAAPKPSTELGVGSLAPQGTA